MVASGGSALDVVTIAQSRTTISLLILVPLLLAIYGREFLRLRPPWLWMALLMGAVGISGANYFYYYAIDKTTVATAIVIQYTAPVWVLLYFVVTGQQQASWQKVIAVVMAMLGIALCIQVLQVGGRPYVRIAGLQGNTLGFLAAGGAAFSFAFYNIMGGKLLGAVHRWVVFAYALSGSVVLWLVINPPWKIAAAHFSGSQWLFMIGFAIFSMLLPFGCYLAGLQYLDVTRAIVVACLEPVFAIALAAVFVGEPVVGGQLVGIVLVLLATVVVQLPDRVAE